MPTADQTYPARLRTRALIAASVAAMTALVVVPGVGYADPQPPQPQPTLEQVQAQVDQLNTEAAVAAERYNDARLALDEVQGKLASLQQLAGSQEQRLDQARTGLAGLASAMYRTGGVDPIALIVASEDPEEFLASSSSLARLTDRQAAALRTVLAERSQLQQDNALVAEQLADLAEAKAEVERQKNEIESKLRAADRLLNSLQAADRERLAAAQRTARDQERSVADAAQEDTPAYTGDASGPAAAAIAFAYKQLGDRYVWGAAGPDAWDCSGLTMAAWAEAGVSLPHSSRAQYAGGRKVSKSELQPGDLVFFYSPISHVGIYIGDGNMIHASNPSKPVSLNSMQGYPFSGAIRP